MNLIPFKDILSKATKNLIVDSNYVSGPGESLYDVQNLNRLRQTILMLENVPGLKNDVEIIRKSWLFQTNQDRMKVNSTDDNVLKLHIPKMLQKAIALYELALMDETNLGDPSLVLSIKIPEIGDFKDLEKFANDLQKAVELPVVDPLIGSDVKIISSTSGSIIFFVLLSSHAAIKLIGKICWSAAVVRKKNAEAALLEQQVRTLEIQNDTLQAVSEGIKMQYKNVLQREASAIASSEYNSSDPELIERIKFSVSTMVSLLNKKVEILPVSNEALEEKSVKFPDYQQLNIIESDIKQIAGSADGDKLI